MIRTLLCLLIAVLLIRDNTVAQDHSAAREWNETILYSISADFARPTVHARNLFHLSIALYDAWMIYEPNGNTYLIGKTVGDFTSEFDGIVIPDDIEAARDETISYAAYRIIEHRYAESPGIIAISDSIQSLMDGKGYDISNESVDYVNGGAAELGNYIASQVIEFGYSDGSNEIDNYANIYYEPVNPPIEVEEPGNPDIIYPNRWQQISLSVSIDQSGEIVENAPPFLSPEWGNVLPFAMTEEDAVVKSRDGHDYKIYKDPGDPALIDTLNPAGLESFYKWNFALVPIWQSHLDTADNVVWDVSPNSVGNIQEYPETQAEYEEFYDFFDGGDPGQGYDLNPVTGQPYEPQMIRRADYARVLAEFWADGPESVTPPGHWFKIYNEVSDHPLFERKWEGQGPELDNLAYDIRAYLAIGGAMHDAAIAAWSIKGYYDYLRPVSAVRFMADRGQCSDPLLPNYNRAGLPLIPGYIELVEIGDPLAGLANQHAGKIKLYTWRGPDYIEDPENDEAGVGWILAENWWPYQRPSFVTPPFAGYISGHSTYSRTAAEVMTLMTGSPFFPGGMSGFEVEQNEFLVFEDGPSETFQLQWATYTDASDQCSLSRIWGGIHPPIDDIPGRKIGMELGPQCFNLANEIIQQSRPFVTDINLSLQQVDQASISSSLLVTLEFDQEMDDGSTVNIEFQNDQVNDILSLQSGSWISSSQFQISYLIEDIELENISGAFSVSGAQNLAGNAQNPYLDSQSLVIDTKSPEVLQTTFSNSSITDEAVGDGQLNLLVDFSEACNSSIMPEFSLSSETDLSGSLIFSETESQWLNEFTFQAVFDVADEELEATEISLEILNVQDLLGNSLSDYQALTDLNIDTRNPVLAQVTVNDQLLNIQDIGSSTLIINLTFDDEMDPNVLPELVFEGDDPSETILQHNPSSSEWIDSFNCVVEYNILNEVVESEEISFSLQNFIDENGNPTQSENISNLFQIDTKRPEVLVTAPSVSVVSDQNVENGFYIDIEFSETMDTDQAALVSASGVGVDGSITNNFMASEWLNDNTFRAQYQISDQDIVIPEISISVDFALDENGNSQLVYTEEDLFALDTENPQVLSISSSDYLIEQVDFGIASFEIILIFQEAMDNSVSPAIAFIPTDPVESIIQVNSSQSEWLNEYTYKIALDVNDVEAFVANVGIEISQGSDMAGNQIEQIEINDFLIIDTQPLSIGESQNISGIEIYPTILTQGDALQIKSDKTYENYVFRLFDSAGKNISSLAGPYLNQGTNTIQIDNYQSGLYIYELRVDQGIARGKLFVK
jgi:hypothetical protein